MSKNRIIFLARQAWPEVGGVEIHLQRLSDRLKNTYKVTIVAEQTSTDQLLHQHHKGIEYYRIPIRTANKKLELKQWWSKHFFLLQEAQIIHVHDVFFWLYPFLPRLLFKKIYTTFHGYEGDNPTWKQQLFHQVAEIFSERNICVGAFHQKWYQVEPDEITFGATDISSQEQILKKKYTKGVFVGRLAADTGIKNYLEALSQLNEKQRPHVDVIGDGPLKAEAQLLVKKNRLPVTFFASRAFSIENYLNYDFACVSGYLSILSALASGLPVISTHSTAIKKDYLYGSPFAQWIQIAENTSQLATELANIQPLSTEAKKWARKQNWDTLTEQYQRIWHD